MVNKTALARERAKRCKWCDAGLETKQDNHPSYPPDTIYHVDHEHWKVMRCQCPESDADLYEELAKERDELLGDKEIVDWITTASCKPAICKCGGKFSLYDPQRITGWYDNPRDAWREFLRAAREKETQNG